jgi:hypothetical protein
MKIKLKQPPGKKCLTLADLAPGDVFSFLAMPRTLYLRTTKPITNSWEDHSIVRLDSGILCWDKSDREVELVHGAFVEDGAE